MAKTKPVRRFGWKRQQPDYRDYRYRSPRPARTLPRSVNLWGSLSGRAPIDPNLDQGDLGSCGPNSVAMLLATNALRSGAAKPPLQSRLLIYYFTRVIMGTVNQDSGVYNRDMFKALNKYGTCNESLWPYVISKFKLKPATKAITAAKANLITAYQAVDQNVQSMKECLADGLGFIFGFSVYDSFMSAEVERTGVVPMPKKSESLLGGHDIFCYGYDDARGVFLMGNEWGEEWGDGGNCTIPYEFAADPNLAGDFWTAGTPNPPPPEPVSEKFRITLEIDPIARTAVQVA